MKFSSPQIPWDVSIFLTVASAGFYYSVQNVRDVTRKPAVASFEAELTASYASGDPSTLLHHVVDLGCLDGRTTPYRLESEDGTVRLKGKVCADPRSQKIGSVRVKNLSNGYEGTVFIDEDRGSFVSDYLVLQAGHNKIELEWKDIAKNEVRKITAEIREK